MTKPLLVALLVLVSGSAASAAPEFVLSYYNRDKEIREETGGFATADAAWAWAQFIQVPYYGHDPNNTQSLGPTYVGFRVYQRDSDTFGISISSFSDWLSDTVVEQGKEQLYEKMQVAVDPRAELAQQDANQLTKIAFPGGTLDAYGASIAQAYERVKKAKEELLGRTQNATAATFDAVNKQVADFNRMVDNPPTGSNPPMTGSPPQSAHLVMVDDKTAAAAKTWKELNATGKKLRDEEQELDKQHDDLNQERPQIVQDMDNVESLENEVISLRNRATEEVLAGRTASGSMAFEGSAPVPVSYEFYAGNQLTYRSPKETLDGTYTVSGNVVNMRMGITTANGTLTGNTISTRMRRDDGRVGEERVTVTGGDLSSAVGNRVGPKQGQLDGARSNLNRRKQDYLRNRAQYQQRASQYMAQHQAMRTGTERLHEFARVHPGQGRPFVPPNLQPRR